jgi:hypothetical protein
MALGGARPGAGRKKGHKASHTIEAEKAREFVIGQVVERLQPIMQSKFALALGHDVMMVRAWEKNSKTGKYERTGKWGQVTDPTEVEELLNGSQEGNEYYQIWTKSPDGNSLQYLLNQTIGKPKETVEGEVKIKHQLDVPDETFANIVKRAASNLNKGGTE